MDRPCRPCRHTRTEDGAHRGRRVQAGVRPGLRALRGGSWNNDHTDNFRAANRNRNQPDNRNNNIGFRIVLPEDPPSHPVGRMPESGFATAVRRAHGVSMGLRFRASGEPWPNTERPARGLVADGEGSRRALHVGPFGVPSPLEVTRRCRSRPRARVCSSAIATKTPGNWSGSKSTSGPMSGPAP
ncbi:MAG: hypothetical protein FJX72_17840 [Armatimonadetes bacterium]|nr:hypothetical protein [Armatimonadota bacterium]